MKKNFSLGFSIFLIFVVLLCVGGCGGGSNYRVFSNNNENNNQNGNNENNNQNETELIINSTYTVTFDSAGETEVPDQIISNDGVTSEPEEPTREGYTFLRWEDENGNIFIFGYGLSDDITLTAQWAETIYATSQEIEALKKVNITGSNSESLEGGVLKKVEVQYKLDEFGIVSILENKNDSMLGVPGLIGNPVDISLAGGKLNEAKIIFHYDPAQLKTNPEDLAILWYDETTKEIKVFDEETVVDTENNTLEISTTHFSKYGVVELEKWNASLAQHLPTVRTSKIHYNLILAIDCSGSMSGIKMKNTITSAQNLVDSITNDDYIAVISFESDAQEILGLTKVNSSNRQEIKNKIGSLYADGGTNFDAALRKALEYYVNDANSSSLIVLLSDGESSVESSTIEQLKNNAMRVMTVGLGITSSSARDLLKNIASETGGSYLDADAENIQEKFSEIAEYDLGTFVDSDDDGIPNIVEEIGMRDQYGHIISTDPTNKDSDGDKIIDGEEMGTYSYSRYIRKSNPLKYTHKVDDGMLRLPNSMQHSFPNGDNQILISIQMLSVLYEEKSTEDFIFQPIEAKDLNIELVSIPDGFKIEKDVQLNSKNIENGILYTASVLLSYNNEVTDLDSVQWKIGLDTKTMYVESLHDFGGIPVNSVEKKQEIKPQENKEVIVDYALLRNTREAMAKVEKFFVEKFASEIKEENTRKDNDEDLKGRLANVMKNIQLVSGTHDDKFAQAFGLAIVEGYDPDGSKIEQYSAQPGELTKQIIKEILDLHMQGNKYVVVGEDEYRVQYDFWNTKSMTGKEADWGYATVYIVNGLWNERQVAMYIWNSSLQENLEALASYAERLAQLNKDVWNAFLVAYVSDAFGLMDIEVSDEQIQEVFDKAEKVIKALCGDKNAANDFVNDLIGDVKEKLTSSWIPFAKNKFFDFVDKKFSRGPTITKTAKRLETAKDKLDKFGSEMKGFLGIFKDEDKQKNTYEAFKTAYKQLEEELEGIDDFTNAKNYKWPEFF